MSVKHLEESILDPNNLDDINKVSANAEIIIGNLPSRMIEVLRRWFPEADITWNCGCENFWINGQKYGMHLNYYWSYKAPMFYKQNY